jgi:hypothetical protein
MFILAPENDSMYTFSFLFLHLCDTKLGFTFEKRLGLLLKT